MQKDLNELTKLIKFLDESLEVFNFEHPQIQQFHTDLKEAFQEIIKPKAREIYKQINDGTNNN